MEVLLDQNCLSTDTKDVLNKCKTEFSKLLNSTENDISNNDPLNQFNHTDDILDAHFSVIGVTLHIISSKKGKGFCCRFNTCRCSKK